MAAKTPRQFLFKASWSGTLGSDEIFVYSRWVTSAVDDAALAAAAIHLDVTDMLGTAVVAGPAPTLSACFPSHVHWTQLKVSPWQPHDNKLIPGRGPALLVLTDVPTGSTGLGLPYQIATALTTRSQLPGRRKYNRFYLPPLVQSTTDGHGVLQASISSAFTSWLQLNITARDAAGYTYVNYNPGTPGFDPAAAEATWPIVDIYNGHRLDTIRRRRNEAPEGRTTLAI